MKEHSERTQKLLRVLSPNHLAKDCQGHVECENVVSVRATVTAMQPSTSQPQPQAHPSSPTQEAEGEPQESSPFEVTSRGTKVCGKGRIPLQRHHQCESSFMVN